jgi:hypothetical protein
MGIGVAAALLRGLSNINPAGLNPPAAAAAALGPDKIQGDCGRVGCGKQPERLDIPDI